MLNVHDGEKFALGSAERQRSWQQPHRELIKGVVERGGHYVGRSIPRNDVLYKVRGKSKCASNLTAPGKLRGRLIRSIHPYARNNRVNVSRAGDVRSRWLRSARQLHTCIFLEDHRGQHPRRAVPRARQQISLVEKPAGTAAVMIRSLSELND